MGMGAAPMTYVVRGNTGRYSAGLLCVFAQGCGRAVWHPVADETVPLKAIAEEAVRCWGLPIDSNEPISALPT